MKKGLLLIVLICFAAFATRAQKVNEKVEIQHSGAWYPGKILKTEGDKYFVSYDGWDDSWNEWVTIENLRGFAKAQPLSKFKVGDHVEVEYGMVPEPATISEVGENKYHIKYDKSVYGDKWVTEKEIKKL